MTLRNWLSGHVDEINGETENFKPIPTAMLPSPDVHAPPPFRIGGPVGERPQVDDEARLKVIADANLMVRQWQAERAADKEMIGKLQGDIAELILTLQSEKRKSATLELDVAQALNNAQTLQTQIEEFRRLQSLTRQLWDRWEIKTPPKTPRAPKKKPVEVEIGSGSRDTTEFIP